MRQARIKPDGHQFFHCMSRVVDRRMILGEEEKEKFRDLMRRCEGFCGVRIVTYSIMSNHFHILVEVPEHKALGEKELLERLGRLYSRGEVREIELQWAQWRRQGQLGQLKGDQDRYQARMGDLSSFMKTLKQRFSQWYNRHAGRKGTLWEERFKSVLVEGRGYPLATMALYIDLNPVRAGLVDDPKEYRWCGYGEAVAGVGISRKGLGVVTESLGQRGDWRVVGRAYRQLLYFAGEKKGEEARRGFSAEKVQAVLDAGGELSRYELLRCRVRYFSDGAVLGSRGFVNEIFEQYRGSYFASGRKEGARPMRGGDWDGLCTARDLRVDPVQAPGR